MDNNWGMTPELPFGLHKHGYTCAPLTLLNMCTNTHTLKLTKESILLSFAKDMEEKRKVFPGIRHYAKHGLLLKQNSWDARLKKTGLFWFTVLEVQTLTLSEISYFLNPFGGPQRPWTSPKSQESLPIRHLPWAQCFTLLWWCQSFRSKSDHHDHGCCPSERRGQLSKCST